MADPQDQPNSEPNGASTPPEKKPPAQAVNKAAKAPAKKAPAKKAPTKKAPGKKAPAKKAAAKKASPKKAPAKSPESTPPKPAEQLLDTQQRIETNGQLAAAKDVAAQAKSTVEDANDPVSPNVPAPASSLWPVPLFVALALSLLAIVLIRQLRRR
jgi:hypothetical protein